MNLFSGLEKFGFSGDEDFDILKEDKCWSGPGRPGP